MNTARHELIRMPRVAIRSVREFVSRIARAPKIPTRATAKEPRAPSTRDKAFIEGVSFMFSHSTWDNSGI
jgi:hypothetical protein